MPQRLFSQGFRAFFYRAITLQDRLDGPWQPSGDPFERYPQALTALAPHVLGRHLWAATSAMGTSGTSIWWNPWI
jgi:hypothetical protein